MRRRQIGIDGRPLESAIQAQILDWLQLNAHRKKWKFWRARPSQYIRKFGSNVGFDLHPSEIGMPDIMGTAYGYTVALEVKRPGGRMSKSQAAWRDELLKSERTRHFVVRSLEETIEALESVEKGV